MFGAIASGRLVQTSECGPIKVFKSAKIHHLLDFQQVDDSRFLINIADADNLNYLVIFLTGSIPLPLGLAGGVYFSWPDPSSPPKWQHIGYISNAKPSSIFKISQLKKLHEMEDSSIGQIFGACQISHTAQIGISIEPESSLVQQQCDVNSSYVFGKTILENFVNFASSYTITQSQMSPNPSETYVPLSTLTNWFTNFQRRLEQNPNFWK